MSGNDQQQAAAEGTSVFGKHVQRGTQLLRYLSMTDEQVQDALKKDRNLELRSTFYRQEDL